jgi:hypothetical protein
LDDLDSLLLAGSRCERTQRWEDACACYERATASFPGAYEAWLRLGAAAFRLKDAARAELAYRRAIRLDPSEPSAWSNLGALLSVIHRDDDAIACLRQALTLRPDYASARINLGYVLLRGGQLAEGFLCLESRPPLPGIETKLQLPRWDGSPLDGRKLLIVSDAGHGDLIQMLRYAEPLRSAGAGSLAVVCPPALKSLVQQGLTPNSVDVASGYDEPLPTSGWHVWTPSSSLPFLCGTTLTSIPARLPYIQAPADRVAVWRHRLHDARPQAALRVGVVWHGNAAHENDAERSLPDLATLRPLAALEGVQLVSLQHGEPDAATRRTLHEMQMLDLSASLDDFLETAAIVSCLDLVISVDTSTAHLAGALGRLVWVLLPHWLTDSRWLSGRSDSPWYPDVMALFRQPASRQWQPVVEDVRQALAAWRPQPRD